MTPSARRRRDHRHERERGHGHTRVLGGDENLRAVHARAAASDLPTGPGGVIASFPRDVAASTSIAVAAARAAAATRSTRRSFETDGAWIDYRGPPGTIPTVSFSDVVNGKVPAAKLRGKIVVVGATAPTLQDVHATPAGGDELMSGPEIQANAIWTAMHGLPLRTAPRWVDLLALVLLACAGARRAAPARRCAVAPSRRSSARSSSSSRSSRSRRAGSSPSAAPLLALALGAIGTIAARYLAERRERRRVDARQRGARAARPRAHRASCARPSWRSSAGSRTRPSRATATPARTSSGWAGCASGSRAQVGLSVAEAELLRHASALHDVGKIGIPDRVLLSPGKLDPPRSARS